MSTTKFVIMAFDKYITPNPKGGILLTENREAAHIWPDATSAEQDKPRLENDLGYHWLHVECIEAPAPLVVPLGRAIHDGDWHDKPSRWAVVGPGQERQVFSTKAEANKYRSIRRKATTRTEADRAYCASWNH